MLRKTAICLGLALTILFISGAIGLIMLRYNVAAYADYWKGRANQPGEFLYIALGDSAAQSLGASKPEYGYVGRIASNIEQATGRKVRVINLSVTGATVEDALREQVPELATYDPDLVTAEIGANDMRRYTPGQFSVDYERFLQALPPGRSVVSNMPVFGGRDNTTRHAADASQTIRELTAAYQIPMADLFGELSNRQSPWIYASDLFHPNNRGYVIWHDAFWPHIEPLIGYPVDSQQF